MPRFEMYLMFAEDDDGNVEASEIEMVCWVNDPNDLREVQDVANEAIQIHLNEAENSCFVWNGINHGKRQGSFKYRLPK